MRPQLAIATSFLLLAILFPAGGALAQIDDGKAGYKDYRKIQEVEMDKDIDKLFNFADQTDKAERMKLMKRDDDMEDARRSKLRSRFREFDVSHDFDKKDFSDTLDNDMRSIGPKEVDRQDNLDIHDKERQDRRRERRKEFLTDEELMRELSRLPQAAPDDWVPDKADPVNNGGFSIAPDNGSPVPYKLNGWIDFQRKFPWEDEN